VKDKNPWAGKTKKAKKNKALENLKKTGLAKGKVTMFNMK
jgi:hypothetical protein